MQSLFKRSMTENHSLFTAYTITMTKFRRRQEQAAWPELVSKLISKNVTKYVFKD